MAHKKSNQTENRLLITMLMSQINKDEGLKKTLADCFKGEGKTISVSDEG